MGHQDAGSHPLLNLLCRAWQAGAPHPTLQAGGHGVQVLRLVIAVVAVAGVRAAAAALAVGLQAAAVQQLPQPLRGALCRGAARVAAAPAPPVPRWGRMPCLAWAACSLSTRLAWHKADGALLMGKTN